MGYTIAEKILLNHCDADHVEPGQVVMVRCDVVLANDVTGPLAFRQMEKMGTSEVFDRSKIGRSSTASPSTTRAVAASSTT